MKRYYRKDEAQERILLLEGSAILTQIILEKVGCTIRSCQECSLKEHFYISELNGASKSRG